MSEYRTVAELLAVPERWAQGEMAFDGNGEPVGSQSSGAVRWCLFGAISRVYGAQSSQMHWALAAVHDAAPEVNIAKFNDTHTHAQVLSLAQKAGI